MPWPISTGAVCKLMPGVKEYQLNNLIRLGKLDVPLQMGRRAWNTEHVLQAAKLLGRDSLEIRNLCASVKSGGA